MRYDLNFLTQDVVYDLKDRVPSINLGSPLQNLKLNISDIWKNV